MTAWAVYDHHMVLHTLSTHNLLGDRAKKLNLFSNLQKICRKTQNNCRPHRHLRTTSHLLNTMLVTSQFTNHMIQFTETLQNQDMDSSTSLKSIAKLKPTSVRCPVSHFLQLTYHQYTIWSEVYHQYTNFTKLGTSYQMTTTLPTIHTTLPTTLTTLPTTLTTHIVSKICRGSTA